MLYRKMSEAQTRVGPTLLRQPSRLHSESGGMNESQFQPSRVVECHNEDENRQANTQASYTNNITAAAPISSSFNDIPRGMDRVSNLRPENGSIGYSTDPEGSEYPNQREKSTLGQEPHPHPYQYPNLYASTSTTSPSSPTMEEPNLDNPTRQFAQQQQPDCYSNMNSNMIPQDPYQLSPPSRPGSSSSLSVQVQMMMENLLYQQSQPSRSNNQLLSEFENIPFLMSSVGAGNENFQGSILGEEYPITDS